MSWVPFTGAISFEKNVEKQMIEFSITEDEIRQVIREGKRLSENPDFPDSMVFVERKNTKNPLHVTVFRNQDPYIILHVIRESHERKTDKDYRSSAVQYREDKKYGKMKDMEREKYNR